ncbi:MAG: glycoside hydrolase domain-containing protein [Pyrinomonadaceae bacterium]
MIHRVRSSLLAYLVIFVVSVFVYGQDESPFSRLQFGGLQSPPPSSEIKNIQSFNDVSGIAYTWDSIFRTDDSGVNWRKLPLRRVGDQLINSIFFSDVDSGSALLSDSNKMILEIARTHNGGQSWTHTPVSLPMEILSEVYLEDGKISVDSGTESIIFRLPTSSNFVGTLVLQRFSDTSNWVVTERSVEPNTLDEDLSKISRNWELTSTGSCDGFKTGCLVETRINANGKDITPAQIKERVRKERSKITEMAKAPVFSVAPGGTTRISLSRGFDKCTAGTVAQMQTWWDASHFYDSNIYFSGRNRSCSQPQLTADWVDQVSRMGWGLIPTVVGYQSPCSVSANSSKHSSEPAMAEQQGRTEADIAVADANNIGLTVGTVLYYDMERYDETAGTPGCRIATTAFLKGWTDRLKELGYKSGTYGSPKNAQEDWVNLPAASQMDAIWMARWDNIASVWSYVSFPFFPADKWANHQRIKQWQAPHNETWGGVTFNIDGNIADGPVAGIAVRKNKKADFDGDGRTDMSIFRADPGVWFVYNSSNLTYKVIGFGLPADIATPGDYDGDGRTDYSIFRPSENTWYFLTKGEIFSGRQFGAAGDIPAPGDYNGDGKTDVAVFRPSNGTWYIANSDSQGTYTFTQFGAAGDKPVLGDYDGDGKDDVAVFRPSNGGWYILRSSDGAFSIFQWGTSTDQPAQGDFDGDGKTDAAILRDGTWYLRQSTGGQIVVQFGLVGDLPVTGDFDDDGRDDISVFRPSDGIWYLLRSRDGFIAAQFGAAGDIPVPNAYLRH